MASEESAGVLRYDEGEGFTYSDAGGNLSPFNPADIEQLRVDLEMVTAERDGLLAELGRAQADRNDYAARLKAADASWAKVAGERDVYQERFEAVCKRLDDEAQQRIEWWGERDRLRAVAERYGAIAEAARALCLKASPGRELHIDGPVLRAEFRAFYAAVTAEHARRHGHVVLSIDADPPGAWAAASLLPTSPTAGSNQEETDDVRR